MDTSETYLKMCERAEEIQGAWQISSWDYCYCEKEGERVVLSGYETDGGWYGHGVDASIYSDELRIIGTVEGIGGCGKEGRHIWLPRQDQLQEMIMPKDRPVAYLLNAFLIFCGDLPLTICNAFASFEQLWLAFVMKQNYNKLWINETWS